MPFLPPSCRFPPLREGNRAEVRFPLPAGFPSCVRGTRKARFPLLAGFSSCVRGTQSVRFPLPAGGTLKSAISSRREHTPQAL
jgi:hypothetical protein